MYQANALVYKVDASSLGIFLSDAFRAHDQSGGPAVKQTSGCTVFLPSTQYIM